VQALATPAAILAVAEELCLADAEQSNHAAVEADQAFLTKLKNDFHKSVAAADAVLQQSHVAVLLQSLSRADAMLLHLAVVAESVLVAADSVCLTE